MADWYFTWVGLGQAKLTLPPLVSLRGIEFLQYKEIYSYQSEDPLWPKMILKLSL